MNLYFLRLHLRLILGSTALVLALAALGLAGIVSVRFLPDAPVLRHAEQSVGTLVKEGDWPLSLCSRQDNFMDSMSLNIASYWRREGALECALKNYFWKTDASEGVDALAARFARKADAAPELKRAKYVRYWFGCIAVARPFLCFMDYPQWRVLNTVGVFAVLLALLSLLYVSGRRRYGLPLLVAFALMDPVAIGKSIQFSPCFYLSTGPSLLVLVMRKSRFADSPTCQALFFSGIGALTSYFDLLTYPILTFALPMAFCLLLKNQNRDIASEIWTVALCLMHWFLGFVLMWLLKWVLVTACTDVNAFYEVFQKIGERSGNVAADGLKISRHHAVVVNLLDFLPHLNVWLFGGFALALVSLWRGGRKLFLRWLPAFVIAALPPAWMFLTANHAYIHHFFVSKSLAVSVFVFLCWTTDAFLEKGGERRP